MLILSITSVFASSFTGSTCETMSVISSFLRTVSVSMLEAICPSFPEPVFTSVENFEPSCTPVQCSFTTIVFTRPGTSVQEEKCCCWLCQLISNFTLGTSLGVSSLSNRTHSPFWDATRSIQSPGIAALVMIANDFVCQNCNPWSCAFDNRTQHTAFWSYFHFVTWGAFCGTVKSSWGLPSSGSSPKDSFVLEKLLDGLCLSPFLLESVLFPSMDWEFHERPLWFMYLFQLRGINT